MTKKLWKIEPHTKAKHIILRKYLDAWLPIIARWNGRVVFVDGFAGPGIYEDGEEGSPVIAIKAFQEHIHREKIKTEIVYLFIEERKDRFESLKDVIDEYRPSFHKNIKVEIIHNEYATAFCDLLDKIDEEDLTIAPTFAFVDPFGVKGIPLEIFQRLMNHDRTEILINIMIGHIHRFLERPEFEPHCDDLFGCSSWRDASKLRGEDREIFLRKLYEDQLRDYVGAKYVRFFTMKNSKNRTIYDLFFATNSPKGIDKMKDVMWKLDTSGGYQFSDATNPEQEVLFTTKPNWDQLIESLCRKFSGQAVPWSHVEEEIRQSPFRILKTVIKNAANDDNSRLRIDNPNAKRKDTLNDHAQITFI